MSASKIRSDPGVKPSPVSQEVPILRDVPPHLLPQVLRNLGIGRVSKMDAESVGKRSFDAFQIAERSFADSRLLTTAKRVDYDNFENQIMNDFEAKQKLVGETKTKRRNLIFN